jgi:hypothetical protein
MVLLVLASASCSGPPQPAEVEVVHGALVDDHLPTITAANADSRRQQLIAHIWGNSGFPSSKLPTGVVHLGTAIPSDLVPMGGTLPNVQKIDQLNITMDAPVGGSAETTFTYHIVPSRKNNRLVILNPGHAACAYNDDPATPASDVPPGASSDVGQGMGRTLNALLLEGYSVLVTYMPHIRPGQCGDVSHDTMFGWSIPAGQGSAFKWFLEPIAVSLNYLKTQYAADAFPQYLRGSPVSVGSQSYVRGKSGQTWRFDGSAWNSLGGLTYY